MFQRKEITTIIKVKAKIVIIVIATIKIMTRKEESWNNRNKKKK